MTMKGDTKKRIFDIAFSSVALVVAAVPMAALYVATRIKMGRPVIFTQQRVGKGGELFDVYKFRSMKDEYDQDGVPLPDEQRVTSFGKLMRTRGIDELPQLFNILKGDMSVVGPRPRQHPPLNDTDMTIIENPEILNIKPGLASSGKAEETKRREKISFSECVVLDIEDARRPWSLSQDFNLIVKVLPILAGVNPNERTRLVMDQRQPDNSRELE